jgi:hypothetical protein
VLSVLALLHRVLNYKMSVAALIEVRLWLAIPYITIGVVWSAFHPAYTQQIQTHLEKLLPAGSELVAFVDSALLWPVLLFAADICPT